jgi:membrane fusion protein (multidrug efflux system)
VDSLWVIDEGLKPGDTVVTEGVQKVRQGQKVLPSPAGADSGKPVQPPTPGNRR